MEYKQSQLSRVLLLSTPRRKSQYKLPADNSLVELGDGGKGRKFDIDFQQFATSTNFLHTNYQKANVGAVKCGRNTE